MFGHKRDCEECFAGTTEAHDYLRPQVDSDTHEDWDLDGPAHVREA